MKFGTDVQDLSQISLLTFRRSTIKVQGQNGRTENLPLVRPLFNISPPNSAGNLFIHVGYNSEVE